MKTQRLSDSATQRLSDSATQRLSDSATQRLSDSATQRLSDSATQRLSDSATQRSEGDPCLKTKRNPGLSEEFPSLYLIVLSRYVHNLERCLQSVFELDYPKEQIEISVVEYGPHPPKAQHLLKKYPDVSFFLSPKKSRSAAQNYLSPQIKEKFVAYVDGDIVLHKNRASHCIEATEGKVNVAAVSGPVRNYQNIDNGLELKTSAVLIEKSALKRIGCFKPIFRNCEGVDLACRFFSKGFYIAIISQAKSIGGHWKFPPPSIRRDSQKTHHHTNYGWPSQTFNRARHAHSGQTQKKEVIE